MRPDILYVFLCYLLLTSLFIIFAKNLGCTVPGHCSGYCPRLHIAVKIKVLPANNVLPTNNYSSKIMNR
jgi:hypothetical protein